MQHKIQPGEYSMGGGQDGVIYNRNQDGNSYVRYMYWDDDRWNWNANWLDNDWSDSNPALVRAIHSISNAPYLGSICFSTCPSQPPSILPMASSCSESVMYFFVSSDLLSHRMSKKIFTVSSLRILSRR